MDDCKEPKGKQIWKWVKYRKAFLCSVLALIVSVIALHLSNEANVISKDANELTKTSTEINAEVQWNVLLARYNEVDDPIRQWEESKGLKKRDGSAITSQNLLDKYIKDISRPRSKCKPTTEIIRLYQQRLGIYESLKNVAKLYEPVKDRLQRIDFTLPNPPRRPRRSRGLMGMGMGMGLN
ncbi:MAG: hypothetical protein ABIN18_24105 [Pseudomonadota bacterium]